MMITYPLLIVLLFASFSTFVQLASTERCIRSKPANCLEVLQQGFRESGVYTIYPWAGKYNFSVFCDMDTDGGGWVVFQRRADFEPRQSFFQNWETYSSGFGELNKEFWLGNRYLNILTSQDYVTLRVDLEDFEGVKRYAGYQDFHVFGCQHRYKLRVGTYYGDAGDSLNFHTDKDFSAFDDDGARKCANAYKSGWWFGTTSCYSAHLNGFYFNENTTVPSKGVHWHAFRNFNFSLKRTEMKFRPSYFP